MALQISEKQTRANLLRLMLVGAILIVFSILSAVKWLSESPEHYKVMRLNDLVLSRTPVEQREGRSFAMIFSFQRYAPFKVLKGNYECCQMDQLLETIHRGDSVSLEVAQDANGNFTSEIYSITLHDKQFGSIDCIAATRRDNGFYAMLLFLTLGLGTMGYALFRVIKENIDFTA